MFVLKKAIGAFLGPLQLALLVALVALAIRWSGRRRAAAYLWAFAAALAYVGSLPAVGDVLLGALERQYAPLQLDETKGVSHIVVLGSLYAPRAAIPISGALDADGLARIVEGVRLGRQIGSATMILSGGASGPDAAPAAQGYRELAVELGLPSTSMVLLDSPLDTQSEARQVVGLLGQRPFILVTSAYHMPRAMLLMQRAGARPIAAPAGHRVRNISPGWRMLLPSASGLQKSELALHEYFGLLAARLGA
jgi:uncharacterized SAM-binding protein YcdF (DUF218 family)